MSELSLDSVLGEIKKNYGDIVEVGVEMKDYPKIRFSSPRLNYMTFGGLRTQQIYEFSGPESSRQGPATRQFSANCKWV